jgi:hypothetical protein
MKVTHAGALAVIAALSLSGERPVAQGAASPDQMVASLKTNLQESQKRLRTYQWIETTVISLKGEEKSRKQQQVYYGADGKLTKTPMGGAPQPQQQQQASRGAAADGSKKSSRTRKTRNAGYGEKGVALIQRYVPPSPN